MEMSKRELNEKNRIYAKQKKHPKFIRNAVLLAIAAVYVFLFTSGMTLPQPITSASSTTKCGEAIEFAENRSATLISSTYDEEKKMMEIVMNLENNNYDNIDDYYYAVDLVGASPKGVTVNEKYNEELLTVIQINNVPKDYTELLFYFAPKLFDTLNKTTDDMTGTIIINKHNVINASIDLEKSKTDYLLERLDNTIANYEARLARQEKKLEKAKNRIDAINKENEELEKNMRYMTENEIVQAEETIIDNKEKLVEAQENVEKIKSQIEVTKTEIETARAKRNEF